MRPFVCPTCQAPLTFIALVPDPEPIIQILARIGETTSLQDTSAPEGPWNSYPSLEFLSLNAPWSDPSLESATRLLYGGVAVCKQHVRRIMAYLGWAACAARKGVPI